MNYLEIDYGWINPVEVLTQGVKGFIGSLVKGWKAFLGYSTTLRNNMLDEISPLIDAGTQGFLRIYEATQPSVCAALGAQTLLAELTFSATAFNAASSGQVSAASITADSSADNTGTAAWFRCVDSTGTCVMDGTAGTSGTDMILNTASITAGQQVSCSAFTITAGNAS